jgi:TetR/AcrR family transcriptional repressor of nem operon
MRVTKQQQQKNRTGLVKAAARLLRKRGVGGIGVDALAKAAGVTHGAVYSQFAGKDELAAAAIAHSLQETSARWRTAALAAGPRGSAEYFNELVRHYVSRAHRDHPAEGCAVAALAADARHHGPKVRHALSDHIAALADKLSHSLAGASDDERQKAALAAMTTMVGAIVLARGVEDPILSDRILLTARQTLMRPARS